MLAKSSRSFQQAPVVSGLADARPTGCFPPGSRSSRSGASASVKESTYIPWANVNVENAPIFFIRARHAGGGPV